MLELRRMVAGSQLYHNLGGLEFERVGSEFAKVLGKLEEAKRERESDSAKADQLASEATSNFKDEVQKPLELLIKDLFKQTKAAKGNEKLSKTRLAYQAELARVNIFLVYARNLAEGDVRDSYLERGLKLADFFVNERDEFYIMRYEAQIQKGLYLYEMKRYAKSAEELELIFDIEPFARPPYSPQLLKAFHTIRLKAYLFSAKAYNSAGKPGIAVSILKPIMRSTPVPGDPFAPACLLCPGWYECSRCRRRRHLRKYLLGNFKCNVRCRHPGINGDMQQRFLNFTPAEAGISGRSQMQRQFILVAQTRQLGNGDQASITSAESCSAPDTGPGSRRNKVLKVCVEIRGAGHGSIDILLTQCLATSFHSPAYKAVQCFIFGVRQDAFLL